MTSCSGTSRAIRAIRLLFLPLLLVSAAAHATVTLTPISGQSVREGETLQIPLNAADTENDNITFTTTNLPGFCTLTDDAGPVGEIECTPGEFDSGNSNITVTATDDDAGGAESDSDNFVLTVTENNAPTLSNIGNESVEEGDSLSIPLSASDPDVGDTVSFSISGFPASCVLDDNGDGTGSVDCDPVDGDANTYPSATVTATDNAPFPLEDSDTITLTVTENQAPSITTILDQTIREGAILDVGMSATDPEGDSLTWSDPLGFPSYCSYTDSNGQNANLRCSPGDGDATVTNITVRVTDNGLIQKFDEDTFQLTVAANTPPNVTNVTNQTVAEGSSLNIGLNGSDPDGDSLTWSDQGTLPGFCSFTDNSGNNANIQCNPQAGDESVTIVTVRATDNGPLPEFTEDTFQLTVGANSAPVMTTINNQAVEEGDSLTINFSAADADGGDVLTFTTSNLPGFCTLTDNTGPDGSISCTPGDGDANTYNNVTVTVTDNAPVPASDSEQFQLTVTANTAPVLTPIVNQSVGEGQVLNISLNASDDDGDILTFSTSGLPGFCTLTDNTGPAGNIQCSPQAGDTGTYNNLTVTVTDNAPIPASDSDQFQLTVTLNSPPTLTPIPDQSTGEGVPIDIPVSATDPEGHNITYTATGQPGFCSFTDNSGQTGNFRCSPGSGSAGSWNITITATDDGPVPASSSDLFVLTVSANNPPNLTNVPNQSMGEGDTLDIPLSATDPDGGNVTFTTAGLPGFCALTDNTGPAGNIQCNPQAGDGGTYNNITVTATDDGVVPASSSDQFNLSVSANSPPSITPIDDQQMIEGETLNIPIIASDPEGQNITFSTSGLPGFCTLTDATGPTGAISCSPVVGNDGSYPITVTATDDGGVPASTDEPFLLTVGANAPPTATNVAISGTLALGEVLTGSYTYNDAEGDLEGTSTFRWLRDGVAIPGATSTSYTVVEEDIEAALVFEVTPVAQSGATTGSPVESPPVTVDNVAPSIDAQAPLETLEDTAILVALADLTVTDSDNDYPDDFTIAASPGADYTVVPAADNKSLTITPALDFNGPLTVPVTVNDGFANSPAFDLAITVTPVNDAPTITGLVAPLSTGEDEPITIAVTDLTITDPDNVYPTDFTLTLQPGTNYTLSGNEVIPEADYNGALSVPATVNDGELDSAVFNIPISVAAVNDLPVLVTPIEDQQAVEDQPFTFNISGNFSDPEGEALTYQVAWLPIKPPSISFNGQTGVFSGTPRAADAGDPGPVYTATVTARDPSGDFVTDEFVLSVSLRDRANLALSIEVAPETGFPGDDLRFTLTARNPVGPQPGSNVELTGSFVGSGLTVAAEGAANCVIEPPADGVTEYVCQLGNLPVGGTNATVFTVTTNEVSEVYAYATAAGAQVDPIDPNLDDNSDFLAAAVADSFSVGAVQILGNGSILSLATGDLTGDLVNDIVAGTVAGQNILVYPNDLPRESCDCQRDFLRSAIAIPDTGAQEGVALADFDRNGTLDIVVVNGGGQTDRVYSNDGAGNFTLMATLGDSFGHDVAVGDFNNDGNADIAIAAVGGNPIWHGDGSGGFTLHTTLGNANSLGVAVAKFDDNNRDDVVFANVGSASRVWTKNANAGFTSAAQLNIGDAVSVAAGLLDGDARPDLVFARVPNGVGDVPANPVILNNGDGTFPNAPLQLIGISPTNDVLIDDINGNGLNDLVFINASGVHQVWNSIGGSYILYREHIIDIGAVAGVTAHLGDIANGITGGVDLAMAGALGGGVAVYLNDGQANLGRGDTEPPVITLSGASNVRIEAGEVYRDSGATAVDNIDGDITGQIVVVNSVNTAVVGTYTVTYNVNDFAGNEAVTVTRTVAVDPAANSGGGGGGSLSLWTLLVLFGGFLVAANGKRRERI
jgi:hypothetical protein